jgi:uncharacterized repeat protein (TIGR01451 family)
MIRSRSPSRIKSPPKSIWAGEPGTSGADDSDHWKEMWMRKIKLNNKNKQHKEQVMKHGIAFLLAVIVLLTLAASGTVYAALPTKAGTTITNTVTLNYKDGANNSYTPKTASATVTVSQIAGVSVTYTGSTTVKSSVGNETIYFGLMVTNTGNYQDVFDLSLLAGLPSGWSVAYYTDANHNGAFDAEATLAGSKTEILDPYAGTPNPDGYYIVAVTVPSGVSENVSQGVSVKAQSEFDNSKSANQPYTVNVQFAQFATGTKNNSNGTPVTGGTITYTISYTNGGHATAYNAKITDPVPTGTTISGSPSITAGGGSITLNGSNVEWTGSIAAGVTVTISFAVTVNSGTTGTISNAASIAFDNLQSDGTTYRHETPVSTNTSTSTVATGWTMTVAVEPGGSLTGSASQNVIVGRTAVYKIVLTNSNGSADNVTINTPTHTGTLGGSWTYSLNADGTSPITLPLGPFSVSASGSYTFYASLAIPASTDDNLTDAGTYTATPVTGSGLSVATTTLAIAPKLVLTKTVSPLNAPPGSTVTYTLEVDNNGHAAAVGLAFTDPLVSSLTYVTGSITVKVTNTGSYTAAADNVTTPGVATTTVSGNNLGITMIPDLAANDKCFIQYQATIK